MVRIDDNAPDFKGKAFVGNEIKEISLDDYKGKWVILFFYPADFTFVCPTELIELSNGYDDLRSLNAEVISVSTDTVYSHKAWKKADPAIGKILYPMLADPSCEISRKYLTLVEDQGLSLRATFLIDPDGIIKAYEFHNNDIGRSFDEIKRKLEAAKFVYENNGSLCPMNWRPGQIAINDDSNKL